MLQDIAYAKQEHFICLTLDSGGRLIKKRLVFLGTLTQMVVHPREIFAVAVEDRAAGIILAHNHPSFDPSPSQEDVKTTQQMTAAGLIMGIEVYDHVIVAGKRHYSFKAHGLM